MLSELECNKFILFNNLPNLITMCVSTYFFVDLFIELNLISWYP